MLGASKDIHCEHKCHETVKEQRWRLPDAKLPDKQTDFPFFYLFIYLFFVLLFFTFDFPLSLQTRTTIQRYLDHLEQYISECINKHCIMNKGLNRINYLG